MNGMDQERFEDLKDAYVLGALPEEERLEFEQYLAAHPDLQAEIEELSTIAGLLAFSPQEQEPPPELRRRIMDTVEAEAVQPRTSQPPVLASKVVGGRGSPRPSSCCRGRARDRPVLLGHAPAGRGAGSARPRSEPPKPAPGPVPGAPDDRARGSGDGAGNKGGAGYPRGRPGGTGCRDMPPARRARPTRSGS